jgi:hypothetical protein
MCRYECGTELGDFDEKQNKYLELSGTLHTRERCESLKNRTPSAVPAPTSFQVPQSEVIKMLDNAVELIETCRMVLEKNKLERKK